MSLTGGPHLDPVVLMCPADDILGPDAEAVVPRVHDDGGHVVNCAGHGHRATLVFLQREALGLDAPAHGQRGAAGKCGPRFRKGSAKSVGTDQGQGRPGGQELHVLSRQNPQRSWPHTFQTGEQQWIEVGTPRGFQAVRQAACADCWRRPNERPRDVRARWASLLEEVALRRIRRGKLACDRLKGDEGISCRLPAQHKLRAGKRRSKERPVRIPISHNPRLV